MPPLGYESYQQVRRYNEIPHREVTLALKFREIFRDFTKYDYARRGVLGNLIHGIPKETPKVRYDTGQGGGHFVRAWLHCEGPTKDVRLYTQPIVLRNSKLEETGPPSLRVSSMYDNLEFHDMTLQNLTPDDHVRCLQDVDATLDLIAGELTAKRSK